MRGLGLPGGRGRWGTQRPQYCATGASVSTKAGGILPSGSCLPGGRGRLSAAAGLPGACFWLPCCALGSRSSGLASGNGPKRASAAACRTRHGCCQHYTIKTAAPAQAGTVPQSVHASAGCAAPSTDLCSRARTLICCGASSSVNPSSCTVMLRHLPLSHTCCVGNTCTFTQPI